MSIYPSVIMVLKHNYHHDWKGFVTACGLSYHFVPHSKVAELVFHTNNSRYGQMPIILSSLSHRTTHGFLDTIECKDFQRGYHTLYHAISPFFIGMVCRLCGMFFHYPKKFFVKTGEVCLAPNLKDFVHASNFQFR